MSPGDRQKLLRVRPRSLSELARQARQAAGVPHVVQEFGRTVCVRGDDDLTGGPGAVVQMRRALSPAGMTGTDLEPASIKRREVVHLVQRVDLDAEFLRHVEVIRRQLVLGVVPAAVVAVAARYASGAPRSGAAEVRVVGLDARAAEVDAYRGFVERFSPSRLVRELAHVPVYVGGHVGVAARSAATLPPNPEPMISTS